MKLMDIVGEHLGMPDFDFQAVVQMPSVDFARICKYLSSTGNTGIFTVVFLEDRKLKCQTFCTDFLTIICFYT